jgi:ribosomal protein L12E/L44/L45/RPP1/RPP2
MEAEVFLLGHYKNFDELEETMTLPELMATIGAVYEREKRNHRFVAALKGIDIDENSEEETDDVAVSPGSLDMFGMGYTEEGE